MLDWLLGNVLSNDRAHKDRPAIIPLHLEAFREQDAWVGLTWAEKAELEVQTAEDVEHPYRILAVGPDAVLLGREGSKAMGVDGTEGHLIPFHAIQRVGIKYPAKEASEDESEG